jgi:hypothetical protein
MELEASPLDLDAVVDSQMQLPSTPVISGENFAAAWIQAKHQVLEGESRGVLSARGQNLRQVEVDLIQAAFKLRRLGSGQQPCDEGRQSTRLYRGSRGGLLVWNTAKLQQKCEQRGEEEGPNQGGLEAPAPKTSFLRSGL